MMTLRQFIKVPDTIQLATTWYLTDISEAKGKQELFTKQSPQRLKTLREHALIESVVSSNRIEGVEIDKKRIGTVLFGKSFLRDRNEEEIHGYRKALGLIHEKGLKMPLNEKIILQLHKLCRGKIWDAGKCKKKDGDIIEKFPDGKSRIRFKTVSAVNTPKYLKELFRLCNECLKENRLHPLILMAAFNLDFLCIHPFRDGNGRVSRLLLLLQCYHLGYEVGRYISLERLIEQNKERYYETLKQSSEGWHEGKHDPWPYINYCLYILKTAYMEFEERLGRIQSVRGEKRNLIINVIENADSVFRVADIQKQCPGVSIDMIRRTLKELKAKKEIKCLNRGQNAQWARIKKTIR